MDKVKIEEKVRQLVGKYTQKSFTNKVDLFSAGTIDSYSGLQLTLEVEKAFNIKISDAEVKNLRTVEAIASFVAGKLR